ncbi:hypothetical protein O0I10_009266 [Lichtheimia ornata]|uniref:EF-hand domain-containing protein n=1 Tax=Lichtheimia ornata TaxID=688661 RepID=A0AAD7UWR3_9FUNG|nr:uncharacterized protein O0I10_009266 [Lichtheimia ornata]KAJ8655059.1 hypothetical protein O0I10_009266 [Lichtheimia ornata]
MGEGGAAGAGDHGAAWDSGRRRSSSASTSENEKEKIEPAPLSRASTHSSTDDEGPRVILEGGIPAEVPLDALAGPGLVTNYVENDQFDWGGADEADEEEPKDKKGKAEKNQNIILCLSKNSSYIAWSLLFLFALILIAITIALFVVYDGRTSMVSYNLQLWFTWATFMWCISMALQVIVELVPWAIKRLVGVLRPHSTEVLRMRLAYYMALRPFIKMMLVSAWSWGSWSFISRMVSRPGGQDIPNYVNVFYSIWESVFFAALLLFIEKFILQLIVTSFHKKAYGDRIAVNDHALKILDRLKKPRRKTPQDFLKRIRRNKNNTTSKFAFSRSNSADDAAVLSSTEANPSPTPNGNGNGIMSKTPPATRSIMRPDEQGKGGGNVHFPSSNMDTLIAIPALESRSDDEKVDPATEIDLGNKETLEQPQPQQPAKSDFLSNLTKKLRDVKNNKQPKPKPFDPTAASSPPESPPQLSRNSTFMSWMSTASDDRYLNIRDKAMIPGRLIRGGYRKLRSTSHQSHGGSSNQAKSLAKRIYHNIVGPTGNRPITEMDLYPFFRTHQEAAEAFRIFDRDGNGDISKSELRSACVRIYRERKNLARSMRDLSQATGKLDLLFLVVFIVIWVIIVCAAFGVDVGTQLLPLWSAFIAASFVFGNSAKDAFEAIIFVFVTHPFDAGDRVFIGEENWVVENVGLLMSTFIKWDGSVVYAKNSVLATQYIINARRTGPTGEVFDLNIAFNTPSWKIYQIRDHMCEFTDQRPGLYRVGGTTANFVLFENQNRITITFYFEHSTNWQDAGGRWLRHNTFVMELKEECERLDISYTMPMQPLEGQNRYDVPPELNNMGRRRGYGNEGLHMRQGYHQEDDDSAATIMTPAGPSRDSTMPGSQ